MAICLITGCRLVFTFSLCVVGGDALLTQDTLAVLVVLLCSTEFVGKEVLVILTFPRTLRPVGVSAICEHDDFRVIYVKLLLLGHTGHCDRGHLVQSMSSSSEYITQCWRTDLHSEHPALWVPGIGPIGQYLSYIDEYWEKGVVYFVRDFYVRELLARERLGVESELQHTLRTRIATLNSNIEARSKMTVIALNTTRAAAKAPTAKTTWADEVQNDEGWKTPKNAAPIPIHRQHALLAPPPTVETPNPYAPLEVVQPAPVPSHQAVESSTPVRASSEVAPKPTPKPPSRPRKPTSLPSPLSTPQ